ncbi:TMV resistance protein [Nymphaea thermarum]|nr:TMV resistance protein [Nymphaea thermarum]
MNLYASIAPFLAVLSNEAKLIRRIRRRVSSILSDTEVEKGSACMTGTSGVGGIGKTPSMTALCKELSPAFDGICFASNIRQTEDGEGLLPLQLAKLLNEILRKNTTVGNAGQGVSLTQQRLGSKKLPFMSDEILNRSCQLGFFTADCGKREEWFHGGSQINIVTTRNKEALPCHGLQEVGIYFPKELDGEQLLQLFFHHASSTSQALPPALILFGSPLGLEALKSDQHENVQEIRRINYKSLEAWAKCAFLDIACFFIGQNNEYPVYMWVASGYSPGIAHHKVPQHKSLVKEEGNAKVFLGNRHVHGIDFSGVLDGAIGHALEDGGEICLSVNMLWFSWKHYYETLTFHNGWHEKLCVRRDQSGCCFLDFGSNSMVSEF